MASSGEALRRAREARGLTQLELARRAGISRQGLGALEAGTYQPGVTVAIALARELGDSVEGLFGGEPASGFSHIQASWAGSDTATPGAAGRCIALARVGGKVVAVPYPAARLTMAAPAGIVEQSGRGRARIATDRTAGEIDSALLIAGCDPAVAMLSDWLARHRSPVSAVALPCSSRRALAALAEGRAHVAGVHLKDPGSGGYNLATARSVLGARPAVVVNFARWELGLATTAASGIGGIADLARPGVRLVNREAGSGARAFLDDALADLGIDGARIDGYHFEAAGHLEVAAAIASGRADAGVTIRLAAEALGLPFVSLREESYDLIVLARDLDSAPLKPVLDTLNSRRFALEVSRSCAYDTKQMGQVSARNGSPRP
jgi:molybdate-binding protein/DNA-binding XRE family transcriptional regulator